MLTVERHGRAMRVHVFKLAMPPDIAALLDVNVVAGPPENDDTLDRGATAQRVVHIFFQRHDGAAAIPAICRDDRDRAAVGDPIADALGAESAEDHGVDRADPRAGEHGDGSLRNRRHVNDDAISFADFVSLQDVRETADIAMQLLVSERAFIARLALPENGGLVSIRPGQMAIEAILRDVQFPAREPFRERRLPFQDFAPALLPDEFARLARPEFFRPRDRFAIHPPIFFQAADAGMFCEFAGRLENAFLDEV